MKHWFSYRFSRLSATGLRANPFRAMLEALRKPAGGHPRQHSAVQAYLQEHLDTVNAVYESRVETAGKQGIALRTLIAKEMFESETEEVRAGFQKKVELTHEEAMRRYEEAQRGEPSQDPEDQAE